MKLLRRASVDVLPISTSDIWGKMKAEVQKILKLYEELEEAGETATLTFSTRGGMSTVKLQLQALSPTAPSPPTSTSTPTLPPAPGKRRRHRGARAGARRNQRAAAHQASLAEAATTTSPPRPLQLHPSPPPTSGRRKVRTEARQGVPTFHTLNVDGPSPPTPPPPPTVYPLLTYRL